MFQTRFNVLEMVWMFSLKTWILSFNKDRAFLLFLVPSWNLLIKTELIRKTFQLTSNFYPLISTMQLYTQLHCKYQQNSLHIWKLQKLNTLYKVRLNYRDRKLEEDLKDLITRTLAWFVRIESMGFMNCSKFQLLFYLSIKEESLLHVNCFYCEKVATQVFLNGLVLLIEGIV